MKLTTQQINALASKIYNEIKEEVNNYNESLKSEEAFNKWKIKNPKYKQLLEKAVTVCKAVTDCNIEGYTVDYNLSNIASWTEKDINIELKDIFEATLDLKDYPVSDILKNEIILSTIECDNLDDLINNIKKKYI